MKRQILKALTVLLIISALTGGMAACGKGILPEVVQPQ